MKVLLVYKAHAGGAKDPYTSLLPVGLGYINAFLQHHGLTSRLANVSSFTWQQCASLFRTEQPEVVGISQFTHNRFESLRLAELAKKTNPSCLVVVGGPHATHRYREILVRNPAVDVVILGEGERTFLDLVRSWTPSGGCRLDRVKGIAYREGETIRCSPVRPVITDLDGLPLPAAYFEDSLGVDPHRQAEFIITSRGCPAACSFCASPRFWGKALRLRSPRSIVDEIRYIRDRYGLLYFSIRDDTFTVDRERVLEVCRLLLVEKVHILWNCQSRVIAADTVMFEAMRRAGCECIQLGVESGSSRILRTLGKGIAPEQALRTAKAIREAGINLSVYLISGVPGESDADIQATCDLIEAIRPHDGQVSPLVYYPGTALFSEGVKKGVIGEDLFEKENRESFPVRHDPSAGRATRRLLESLEKSAVAGRFTREDFRRHKRSLGYCHATNLMAGESYEEREEWRAAQREYRDIIRREPDNPWGWLALADVLAETGQLDGAREAFREVLTLLPTHAPAYAALGEISRLSGDSTKAGAYYRKALRLNTHNEVAREGVQMLQNLPRRPR